MRVTSLVLGFGLAASSMGCLQEHTYMDPNQNLPTLGFNSNETLQFSGGGALHGDIGPVKSFKGQQDVLVEGYDDGICTYVTITGVGENGSGYLYMDVMPRVEELPDGAHPIETGDLAYEGTLVMAHADSDDGEMFDATAESGLVTMVKHPDGTRSLEIRATVDDGAGDKTESVGSFKLQPIR